MGALKDIATLAQSAPTSLIKAGHGVAHMLLEVEEYNEPGGSEVRQLQWFPETLTDSKDTDWQDRVVPGGSHPLLNWVSGGRRDISFMAQYTCDKDPGYDSARAKMAGVGQKTIASGYPPGGKTIAGRRDLDIRAEIDFLRQCMYPRYSTTAGRRVLPPPVVRLTVDNLGWGPGGTNMIRTVMTQCEVTYNKLFPSGYPRLVEVSLGFAEVVQEADRVRFIGRQRPQDFFMGLTQGGE
jgi:hypothetical protein